MTYEALLRLAYKRVKELDGEEEAAKLLLMETSGLDPHSFYMAMKKEVDVTFKEKFLHQLDEHLVNHIPVQHLIGYSYFFGHKLIVNEDVLIPRPETENLVEHILYFFDAYFEPKKHQVLDLGTGSGCIGLTLAKEEELLDVTISDISEKALAVAGKNKEMLGVNAKIILSDLFAKIEGKFSILASNPPYIPDNEVVADVVKKEPSVALYGGSLGVDFYDKILRDAKPHLENKALIAFEHGFQQRETIKSFVLKHYPDAIILQMKDLAGKDRYTFVGLGGVLSNE